MKTKHGDYIPLYWECDREAYYVRGHIDQDQARRLVEFEEDLDPGALDDAEVTHTYARWSCSGHGPDGPCQMLEEREEPGPGGVFAITRIVGSWMRGPTPCRN